MVSLYRARLIARSAEHLVELGPGITLRKFGESALFGDLLGRAHEAGPGGARERSADADPAHTEIGCFLHGKSGRADQKVDRFWRDRLHDRRDLLFGFDAGRIETVRAGFRIGAE